MDRLAAARAQRNAQSPQAPQQAVEMSNIRQNGGGSLHTNADFLNEIRSIQDSINHFNSNIHQITSLQTRSLNALPSSSDNSSASSLQQLTDEARQLSSEIKDRIKRLTDGDLSQLNSRDRAMRKDQTTLVRSKFMEALQSYQKAEQDVRAKSEQRVERQYKIVNPEASAQEIRDVIQGGQTQVFAEATMSSRYGESKSAYHEVQVRQEELKKMERTLAELSQMFIDMAYIVDQQQVIFENIEKTVGEVESNTKKGAEQTTIAVRIARQVRAKKKFLFWLIVLIILIAVGVGVGVYYGNPANR